jgi:hypothetical protein
MKTVAKYTSIAVLTFSAAIVISRILGGISHFPMEDAFYFFVYATISVALIYGAFRLAPVLQKINAEGAEEARKRIETRRAARESRIEMARVSLLKGYIDFGVFPKPPKSQSFKILLGDFDISRRGYLLQNSVLMPTVGGEGLPVGVEKPPLIDIYREYKFAEVTDCAVAAEGQPRSVSRMVGTGLATAAVFGPLMGLGASAVVGIPHDMSLAAFRFSDGRRALGQLKTREVIKLKFALDGTAGAPR